jgi:hypothetical protein
MFRLIRWRSEPPTRWVYPRPQSIFIPAVFRAAFDGRRCYWHERIATALRKEDAVVSFNYDTLIDEALRRATIGIWNARVGYGVRVESGHREWSAPPTRGPFTSDYVRLLKPHGSLHWTRVDPKRQRLDLHPEPYGQRPARENVIPPTWDKAVVGEWPWKPIWQQASRFLRRARCLIIIGYSVPQTDLMSRALIKSSVGATDLRLLVVVNPDREARARAVDLVRAAIKPSTRVIELDTLRDLALLLDETRSEQLIRRREDRRLQRLESRLEELESDVDDHELQLVDLEGFESELDRLRGVERRVTRLER